MTSANGPNTWVGSRTSAGSGTSATSIHIADLGAARALRLLTTRRPLAGTDGLAGHHVFTAAPLSGATLPSPALGRVALLAFWEDAEAANSFVRSHPVAEVLAGGWRATLSPLRMFGSWPGLPADLPHGRMTAYDGPAVVLTLGRLRLRRARNFLLASSHAEAAALASPGFEWGSGLARPPVVATCSLWSSTPAIAAYAFDSRNPHHAAMAADHAAPFHRRSAFVRFRPLEVVGSLDGRNPLAAHTLRVASTT
jgi:hypothetical protein